MALALAVRDQWNGNGQRQDWGGFIPRVSKRSRPGVLRALLSPDLFTESAPPVSHVIADIRLALEDHDLMVSLRDHGIMAIVDTHSWRYSDRRTWESTWAKLPYAPERPFEPNRNWVQDYVSADLIAQVSAGCTNLMLPGWFPSLSDADQATRVASWTLEAFERIRRTGVLMPAIAWLPVSTRHVDASLAAAKVYIASDLIHGLYAQLSKVNGITEPLDRLQRNTESILRIQDLGLPVIGGHLGPAGLTMRAVGVTAVDCGPSEDQSFDFTGSIKNAVPSPSKGVGPLAVRMWISELGQTVTASQMAVIRQDRAAFSEIVCRRACHRFRQGRDGVSVAAQHGVICLSEEAQLSTSLPTSVRIDRARRALLAMKSCVAIVDAALTQEDQPLRQDHLDNQLALLDELNRQSGVA